MRCVMQRRRSGLWLLLVLLLSISSSLQAQQQAVPTSAPQTGVPRLIKFAGSATDAGGKALSGTVGITFAIYQDQQGGGPLWMETQNVELDRSGRYTALLGAGKPDGLPMDSFTTGEARWLGVRVNGGEEQPRVLLLSVPYALKAADAQTLGGLPPSAFVLAAPAASLTSTTSAASQGATAQPLATGTTPVTTAGGTVNKLAKFDANADVTNSQVFDNGTNVGIGNTAPAAKLDVSGTGIFRGALSLPATAAATSTVGKTSQPFNFTASSFSSSTLKAVNETFRWQAEPFGNNTATPSGTLNLLFGSGTAVPAETGLKINNKGIFTFAPGQTFPGGAGTVTSVALAAPAADFTVSGSPITGAGTLSFAWTQPPTASNVANAIVKRDNLGNFVTNSVTASSVVSSGVTATTVTAGTVNVTTANPIAILGESSNAAASSIYGHATSTASSTTYGVQGGSEGPVGVGVWGFSNGGAGYGVQGKGAKNGVFGWSGNNSSNWNTFSSVGVQGDTATQFGVGVLGTAESGFGGYFVNNDTSGSAATVVVQNSGAGYLLAAGNTNTDMLLLDTSGNLSILGNMSKAGGSFKIDHPIDPANKYLYHSFVESPDMMNIYNGVVVLNEAGEATVILPDWFEALNRDFRYQLTAIGTPGPNLYVAEEVTSNHFSIAGGKSGAKVSWQVTGVRHDAWAEAHRIPLEVEKTGDDKGKYLHPELFGRGNEMGIQGTAARPHGVKRLIR
jgi:hypothetical protein